MKRRTVPLFNHQDFHDIWAQKNFLRVTRMNRSCILSIIKDSNVFRSPFLSTSLTLPQKSSSTQSTSTNDASHHLTLLHRFAHPCPRLSHLEASRTSPPNPLVVPPRPRVSSPGSRRTSPTSQSCLPPTPRRHRIHLNVPGNLGGNMGLSRC